LWRAIDGIAAALGEEARPNGSMPAGQRPAWLASQVFRAWSLLAELDPGMAQRLARY
jgi:hypothetical protein